MNIKPYFNKANIKKNIHIYRNVLILTIILGIASLFFYIFAPLFILILIIGIVFLLIGFDMYFIRGKRGKKRNKWGTFAVIIIGISYLLSFSLLFVDLRESHSALVVGDEGVIYEESAFFDYTGQVWYFQTLPDNHGDLTGATLRFPMTDSLYHYVTDRDGRGVTYEIILKTCFQFEDDTVYVDIYNSPSNKESEEEKVFIETVEISMEDNPDPYSQFAFIGNVTNVQGDYPEDYLLFVVHANINGLEINEDNQTLVHSRLFINPSDSTLRTWGYTEYVPETSAGIYSAMIDFLAQVNVIMVAILVIFIITLLMSIVLGALKHMSKFFFMLVLVGILVLLVMLMMARHLPIIETILDICEGLFNWGFGIGDLARAVYTIMLIIGMIIMGVLWGIIIGSSLAICYVMLYIVKNFFDFTKDAFEPIKNKLMVFK